MASKSSLGQDHLDYLNMLDEVSQRLDLMPSPMMKQEARPSLKSGHAKVGIYGKLNHGEKEPVMRHSKVKTGILVDIDTDCQVQKHKKSPNFGKLPLVDLDEVGPIRSNEIDKAIPFQRVSGDDSDKENGLCNSNPALGAVPKASREPGRIECEKFQNSSPDVNFVSRKGSRRIESALLLPEKCFSDNFGGRLRSKPNESNFAFDSTEGVDDDDGLSCDFLLQKNKKKSNTILGESGSAHDLATSKPHDLTSNHLKKNEEIFMKKKNLKKEDFKKERLNDWLKDQGQI